MTISRRRFLFLGLGSAPLLSRRKLNPLPLSSDRKARRLRSEAWVELHLDCLSWNLSAVRRKARVPVMGVIKANAYGHGLTECGLWLDRQGIDALMVGNLEEAVSLRQAGVKCPVLNFGPLDSRHAAALVEWHISQSVFTPEVRDLSRAAARSGKKINVHIHIDTGMGRMGIPHDEALPYLELVATLPGISIQGLSTTLTEDPDFDAVQLERFAALFAEARALAVGRRHAASSAALLSSPAARLDMVRPGIVLYGYYPSDKTQKEDALDLKPVLELKSRVAAVKRLRPGDSVSYHRVYKAVKDERIAVIPVGYSDGYPTAAAGRGSILLRGQRCPIIASITANHMVVLVTKTAAVERNDEAVLIGRQAEDMISAHEVAQWAGLSAYKVLISLNPRLPRIPFPGGAASPLSISFFPVTGSRPN